MFGARSRPLNRGARLNAESSLPTVLPVASYKLLLIPNMTIEVDIKVVTCAIPDVLVADGSAILLFSPAHTSNSESVIGGISSPTIVTLRGYSFMELVVPHCSLGTFGHH
jgi:hypothetical protein